jgi:hypothetical protein
MKKTLIGMAAFCLAIISTNAQTPENTQPVSTPAPQTQTWDPKKNPTVTAITSKYEGKYITARPASTEADIFPALGKYESSTNTDAPSVSIALDAENKGMVWVEGLPQGKIKAILRKSPSTYKIPAQKTEDGKDVAEGTLIFDKETNTLSINIGKPFNAENPAGVFAAPVEEEPAPATTSKSKSKKAKTVKEPKAWIYTGTKLVVETAAN